MKISIFFLKLACLIFIIFFGSQLWSQAPYSFNYQGVARNGTGDPLDNKVINLRISVLQSAADGNVQFQEEQSATTSNRGLFSIRIGEGSAIIGTLSNIDWATDIYFIKVEMDPTGGQNFINLGSSQLYSVPYALYAMNAGSSDDTGGGTQNLTLDGSVLSIENGNSVDLSVLHDGVEDADSDPENELQLLSLTNNVLSISSGNSVNLPDSSDGGGNGNGPSVWHTDNGNAVYDGGGDLIYRKNDQNQLLFSSDEQGGFWDMYDENGQFSAFAFTFTEGSGFIGTAGPNGSTNVRMTIASGRPNHGFLGIADEEGASKIGAYVGQSGNGNLFTEGPNGSLNTFITSLSGSSDHGFIAVYDDEDNNKAGMYVDENGQGRIFADFVDNFVDNPEKGGEKIVYTMIQGPESASYLRGTALMENGVATISFPRHFSDQISPDNITVLITPLSADSKGIAVIKKSTSGFKVKELLQGNGNYSFDWEVKGVRKPGNQKSLSIPKLPDHLKENRSSAKSAELRTKKNITSKKSQ